MEEEMRRSEAKASNNDYEDAKEREGREGKGGKGKGCKGKGGYEIGKERNGNGVKRPKRNENHELRSPESVD